MPRQNADDRLFATRWVHVYEEDTPAGAVYRPEAGDIPLSRRPREQLSFGPDGAATLFVTGPDDRLIEKPATWQDAGSTPAPGDDVADIRVVDRSAERLVVQIRGAGPHR
jgi:hypothetical protein